MATEVPDEMNLFQNYTRNACLYNCMYEYRWGNYLNQSYFWLTILLSSLKECMCHPWNYPKPVDKDVPLCQYFGNDCFYSKFQNNTYKQQNCNCLPACNEVNYKYVIDSNRKFSREEIDELCVEGTPHYRNILQSETEHLELLKLSNLTFYLPVHVQTVCKGYVKTQYARIRLKNAENFSTKALVVK